MSDRKSNQQIQSTSMIDIVQPSPLRRRLAILTLIAYIGQPIVATAEIIAAQNAAAHQRPTVDATANGLPLVQIATPSAAGVSHNQYNTFNVDAAGAILNNSAATVQTQQAGYVVGNPNLANGSARIILNEVTSANRSQLNGYTEVAGQRAEVIIANPNGITCNGCGFINTSRGVLTTGVPVMGVGGSLDAYRVTGGDIQIGASGLNGSNLDQLDLISRSLKVNGEIWANKLNAITGPNQVKHTDLGVQLITGDANQPTVGIDVALLGGMYANKIHLIGTEAGVGVNSAGTLAAQAGDFTLDTQGQITLTGNTTSSGNLSLNSAAGINNSGTLDTRQNLQITNTGDIVNSGSLTSQGNLTLNAATLNSSGTLGAGIDGNGSASRNGNLSIATQGQASATGTNLAGGQIAINASAINLGGSFTSAQQNIALTANAGTIDLNNAQTQSQSGNVNLTANGTISNDNGLLLGTQITATGTQLNNRNGQIGAQRIVITGNLLDNSSGLVQAEQLDFTLNNLTNRAGGIHQTGTQPLTAIIIGNVLDNTGGWIQSDSDDLTVGANSLTNDNAGQIVHTGQGTLTVNVTGALGNNGGLISSQGNTSLSAGSLNNQGGVISVTGNGDITSQSTLDNSASGYIGATALTLTANNGAVNNSGGKIEADTGLTLNAQSLSNSGGAIKVLSATDVQANATILRITTTQDLINNALNGVAGFIGSNGQLTLSSAALNNDGGKLYANNDLVLTTGAALSNQSGLIQTDSDLSLIATGALNNQSGTLEANGSSSLFSLTAASIDNTLGGRIANSGTGLTAINGGSRIDNDGILGGNGDLNLNAGVLNNTAGGLAFAGNDLTLGITGSANNSGGNLYATNKLTLDQAAISLNNAGGNISSGNTLILNVADLNNQNGQVQTNADLALDTSGALNNNGGLISSQGITRIGAGSLSNQSGVISAAGNGDITSQSTVDSTGGYIGGTTVKLTANNGSVINRGGRIETDTGLTINTQNLDNSGGAIKVLSATDAQTSATMLRITATQGIINNVLNGVSGFIGSNGQLTLSSAALNNNGGKLYANNNLVLTTGAALSNQSGIIQTDSDLSVTATGALNNQGGTIEANGDTSLFSLTAASIDNTLGGRIANSGTGLTTLNGGSRIDNDGTLGGNGDLNLNAGIFSNTAGGLAFAGNDLTLTITGSVNNSGGNLYAANNLSLNHANASLNNSGGNISSGGNITLNMASANNQNGQILSGRDNSLVANSYTGLGTVAAYGNNTISLQGGYTNAAGNTFASNGNLTLTTTGDFINQTALEAGGGLTVNAANIDNRAGALINSNLSTLNAVSGTITNGGRIEGNGVETHSITFSNSNSVMGDTLNLYATNLDNSGSTAFIGATQSINLIIANTLTNQNGANLYSLGDVNIGSNVAINGSGNLSGNSVSIQNRSATIEAAGNLRLAANTVTNQRTAVGVEWGPVRTGPTVTVAPGYNTQNTPSYTSTLEDQRFSAITTSAGELLAGGNMIMSGATLNNEYSIIIAGAALTTNPMTVNNVGAPFQQREVRSGSISYLVDTFVPQSGTCGWIKINCVFAHVVTTTATTPYSATILSTPVANSNQFTAVQYSPGAYAAAQNLHAIGQGAVVSVGEVSGATLGAGSASQIVEASASTVGAVSGATLAAGSASQIIEAAVVTIAETAGQNIGIANVRPVVSLPTSSLYTIHSQPTQNYLVVTDARFTSYQEFVSSDYMLGRLSLDPQQIQKRLGDGFYEQKLVNEQIMQQTGQRYLGQYATANEQYSALLDAGVSAAHDLQLVPGIALTAQQIAALQQDIVWMEERDVVLTDGSTQRVLAPQLYLSQLSKADLSPSGAIIAANDISMVTSGDINNSGVIQGRNSNILQAKNITNSGIVASQGITLLKADADILNLSGQINGDIVGLIAGRDIVNQRASQQILQTSQREEMQVIFGMRLSNLMSDTIISTQLGLESGIRSTNALTLSAGRDITLIAAGLTSGGDASINAGRNLTAGIISATTSGTTSRYAATRTEVVQIGSTMQAGGRLSMKSGNDMKLTATSVDAGQNASLVAGGNLTVAAAKNSVKSSFDAGIVQQRTYDETVIGSSINAEGDITLAAIRPDALATTVGEGGRAGVKQPGTLTLLSAQVTSQSGQVNLIASNDVAIGTTEEQHDYFQQTHVESSDLFSSSSTTTRTESARTDAIGSVLSADKIDIVSGRDINVTGSSIAGTQDVGLTAANDINIKAATSTYNQSYYSHTTESGLMSGGGIGFTIGSREQTDQSNANGTLQSQNRSLVGSTNGNLTLNAGEHAKISGSDLIAANDLTVTAENITFDTGLDRNTATESHDFKQSGLSIGLSGGVIGYAQAAAGEAKTTVSGNGTARRVANLAMLLDDATSLKNGVSDMVEGFKNNGIAGATKASGISLNISVGSSSSSSESRSVSETVVGSRAIAGGSLTLTATEGDLNAVGSQIAAKDVALNAAKDIVLESAQNTNTASSQSSSSSASVGVSVGVSSQGVGVSANLAVAQASGNSDLKQTIQANTQVSAKNKLTLNSGGNTTLAGAQAKGERIEATVGGNFTVESRQDASSFVAYDQSTSVGLSVPITGGSFSADFNSSNQNIDSNYRSVVEQSGLYAGKEGFGITVQKHTQLDGGILVSEADAGKNSLTTGTFGTRDLQNSSSYQADSNSLGVDENIFSKYGAAKTSLSSAYNNIDQSDQQSGITQVAVAEGTITIASNDAASREAANNVSRDTENANQTVQAFDGQQIYANVKDQASLLQSDTQLVTRVTDDAYNTMFNTDPKVYKVTCPPGENCTKNPDKATVSEVTDMTEIKSAGGNVVVAVNGISNPLERAGDLAFQNTDTVFNPETGLNDKKPETIYLMHYTPASTTVGELLIAGYEKTLTSVGSGTANFLGYTNQDITYADILQSRAGQSTTSLGHSRGTIVQTNAFNILNGQGYTNDQLTVRGVGGAVTAQTYTDAAKAVNDNQGRKITFSYFANDPVSVWAGGNPGTASLSDLWSVATTSNSVHSSYGTGAPGSGQVEILTPNGPPGAVQDNSNLIRFEDGSRVDSNPIGR